MSETEAVGDEREGKAMRITYLWQHVWDWRVCCITFSFDFSKPNGWVE